MSSASDLIDEYQREMKLFLAEQQQTCSGMLGLDQEVPHSRTTDGDYIKAEVKVEEDSIDQQSQLINFFVMDEALNTNSSSTSTSGTTTTTQNNINNNSIALSTSSSNWPVPFCNNSGINTSFCSTEAKDSLDTPTPYCSNAVNGLTWGPAVSSIVHQSPFLSSVSQPVAAASSSSSLSSSLSSPPSFTPAATVSSYSSTSSSSSSSSSSLSQSPSPVPEPFSSSSMSSFTTLSNSRFDLTPPPSSSSTSSSPSSLSLSPPPPPSSNSFLMELGFSPVAPAFTPATRTSSTYITNGLAGSGGMLVSNSDHFLNEPPHQALNEDILEYTDLDKQPMSLYEDFDAFTMNEKQQQPQQTMLIPAGVSGVNSNEQLLEDPDLLEKTILMMQETLQKDSEELSIPFDPMRWSPEHVQRWVSSVCHKNKVPDVSPQFYPMDGPRLCSLPATAFLQYGEAGNSIQTGIECCKVAASLMQGGDSSPMDGCGVPPMMQQNQNHQMFMSSSPCVSPSPSVCSNSQASSTGFSTPSDHSDDETGVTSSERPPHKPSAPSGGGRAGHHKQTIHLWQFLKELLLSRDPAHADCIRWLDQQAGVFKIEDSKKVAYLWGKRKNRPLMNYDKLSRSVRQYYRKGIIKKTEQTRRLVYQFCDGYL